MVSVKLLIKGSFVGFESGCRYASGGSAAAALAPQDENAGLVAVCVRVFIYPRLHRLSGHMQSKNAPKHM